MGKISLNVLLLITLALVGVYAWRSKRREAWARAGRCEGCGASQGPMCSDCAQIRIIQRWLAGIIVLVVAGIAAWLRWPR